MTKIVTLPFIAKLWKDFSVLLVFIQFVIKGVKIFAFNAQILQTDCHF